jgi:hypothetical protein
MEAGSGSGHFSFTNIRLFLQDENVIRGQRESVNEMKIFRAFAFPDHVLALYKLNGEWA